MTTYQINGETHTYAAPLSVLQLVEARELVGRRFAVEVNGQIVPKSEHATTMLADGDRVEIVVAVGGG